MKKSVWRPRWDPWNDRERLERKRQQRRDRVEKAARKVREKIGGRPGRILGWLVKAILSMDPPAPTEGPSRKGRLR